MLINDSNAPTCVKESPILYTIIDRFKKEIDKLNDNTYSIKMLSLKLKQDYSDKVNEAEPKEQEPADILSNFYSLLNKMETLNNDLYKTNDYLRKIIG